MRDEDDDDERKLKKIRSMQEEKSKDIPTYKQPTL